MIYLIWRTWEYRLQENPRTTNKIKMRRSKKSKETIRRLYYARWSHIYMCCSLRSQTRTGRFFCTSWVLAFVVFWTRELTGDEHREKKIFSKTLFPQSVRVTSRWMWSTGFLIRKLRLVECCILKRGKRIRSPPFRFSCERERCEKYGRTNVRKRKNKICSKQSQCAIVHVHFLVSTGYIRW